MLTANNLPNNLNSMTCAQLKDLLKLRDLPVSGKKAELIERLTRLSPRHKVRSVLLFSQTPTVGGLWADFTFEPTLSGL